MPVGRWRPLGTKGLYQRRLGAVAYGPLLLRRRGANLQIAKGLSTGGGREDEQVVGLATALENREDQTTAKN